MTFEPTPRQALILWSLLGKQGAGKQKDISFKVDKADREALAEAKFISVLKAGGAFTLQLEDKGWAWAASHLSSANITGPYSILKGFLARLDDHLKKADLTLADFIGAPPELEPEKPREKKPRIRKPSKTAIRKEIERAYLVVTQGRKGTDARLADVRAEIKDYDRKTIDEGFRLILRGDKKARLMGIDDPRSIHPADIEAAFNSGGEPLHLLWIME